MKSFDELIELYKDRDIKTELGLVANSEYEFNFDDKESLYDYLSWLAYSALAKIEKQEDEIIRLKE